MNKKNYNQVSPKKADILLCVLSYNASSVSSKFIDSLLENTSQDMYDLLWIDNGSTDETCSMLVKHWEQNQNVTIIMNKENEGVINGRNQGFDYFLDNKEYKYIVFLDNDQFVEDNWLEHHLAVMDRGFDMVGVEAWQLSRTFLPVVKNMKRDAWYSYIGCGGLLISRKVVESVGKFDEQFNPSYFEDPDYSFRAVDAGFKIGWVFNAKIRHLPHQTLGKASDKASRFVRSLERFRKKWHGRTPPMIVMPKVPEFDM